MGISISVESIVVSESRRRPGATVDHLDPGQDEVIRAILDHFGWKELPWEEPSHRVGTTRGSFSHSSFSGLATLVYDLDIEDHCPHVLERDTYCTFHIPVDFERPWAGKGGQMGSFVIGSSPRLLTELEVVGTSIDEHTRGNVRDVWEVLIAAACESAALNLPLQLLW